LANHLPSASKKLPCRNSKDRKRARRKEKKNGGGFAGGGSKEPENFLCPMRRKRKKGRKKCVNGVGGSQSGNCGGPGTKGPVLLRYMGAGASPSMGCKELCRGALSGRLVKHPGRKDQPKGSRRGRYKGYRQARRSRGCLSGQKEKKKNKPEQGEFSRAKQRGGATLEVVGGKKKKKGKIATTASMNF